jgi:hypothetical protein
MEPPCQVRRRVVSLGETVEPGGRCKKRLPPRHQWSISIWVSPSGPHAWHRGVRSERHLARSDPGGWGLVQRRLRPSVPGYPGPGRCARRRRGHLCRRAFEAMFKPAPVSVCAESKTTAFIHGQGDYPAVKPKPTRVSRTVLSPRLAPTMTWPTGTVAGDNLGFAEVRTARCDL